MDGPEGPVVEQKAMMEVAVNFYKDVFKNEGRPNIHLADDFWSHNKKVPEEENNVLTAPFTELEIQEAVFSCYAEGAPGPDGISFVFYNKFWDLVKGDLVNMFNEFFSGELDLYRLNFAMISLIPKEEGARSMKKFRPISLINCSFKIFSKVLTLRLSKVVNRLVSPHQSVFIHGRYILESVLKLYMGGIICHPNK